MNLTPWNLVVINIENIIVIFNAYLAAQQIFRLHKDDIYSFYRNIYEVMVTARQVFIIVGKKIIKSKKGKQAFIKTIQHTATFIGNMSVHSFFCT